MSFSAAAVRVTYGGDGFIADLTSQLTGDCQFIGNGTIGQQRIGSPDAALGSVLPVTADGLEATYAFQCTVRVNDALRTLRENQRGFLMVERRDVERGWGLPVVVAGAPVSITRGAALTFQLLFSQDREGRRQACEGPVTAGGTAVSSGVGYERTATGIEYHTSGSTGAGASIVGPILAAEGS